MPSSASSTRKPILWLVAGLALAAVAVLGLALGREWLVVVPVFIFIAALWILVGVGFTKQPKQYSGYDYSLPGHWGRLLSKSNPPPIVEDPRARSEAEQ